MTQIPSIEGTPGSSSSAASPALKVGLALGSGAARGLAHIGVLRAIQEANIKVEVVTGTSMGAFVGASFAAGQLDNLATAFLQFDWKSIVALLDPVFPRSGLIDGQKIGNFVRELVHSESLEHLPIPFRAVATDVESGEEVVIGSGDLIDAVRASIAVPGLLTPVRSNGRVLVDGGLVNPVPVSVARLMGANLVIAVDVNHDLFVHRLSHLGAERKRAAPAGAMKQLMDALHSSGKPIFGQLSEWMEEKPLPGIFEVMLASFNIIQAGVARTRLVSDRPEILIQPPLGAMKFMDFDRAEEMIEIGYRSAVDKLKAFDWSRLPSG